MHLKIEFPEEGDHSVRATLRGVAKVNSFPVHVINVSSRPQNVELLLCYNEIGIFVNEKGHRTRTIDPTWSHLPCEFGMKIYACFFIDSFRV